MSRTVVIFAYPDCHLLDVAGPWQVFAAANQLAGEACYRLHLLGAAAGPIRTNGALGIEADVGWDERDRLGPVDTFLVAGGSGVFAQRDDARLLERLRAEADRVRRFGAICTGAFLLGAAGLLDGRRATTHWRYAERLASEYPEVRVEADALYLVCGDRYTSAGVTAGIDLALSLVAADQGPALAGRVARELVMFLHRPGGQSQFSEALEHQAQAGGSLRRLVDALHADPGGAHDLESMAGVAAVTPRHLSRLFRRHLQTTPGTYLTRLRLERARACLLETDRPPPLARLSARWGLGGAEQFRRLFHRHYGVPPSVYRERFGPGTPSSLPLTSSSSHEGTRA